MAAARSETTEADELTHEPGILACDLPSAFEERPSHFSITPRIAD
jgi:hypothetical protein